jgi:dihydrofolate reductase/dihydrofolate reductase (trimethoprim resistance protein)
MISMIAAISKNNVIGNKGVIPWRIKGEQKRFKELTLGKAIIMGRKTYQEIEKPLPNRKTIVISSTENIAAENCFTVKSLAEAIALTKDEPEIFIAGGGQVYKEAMPLTNRIYLTVIDQYIDDDVYFPEIDLSDFNMTYEEIVEGEIPFTYYTYDRVKRQSNI